MTRSEVVRAYVAALNGGDWDLMRTLFRDDAVVRGVMGWGGLDVALPVWRELHEGLCMTLEVEDLVESGDTVVARYVERGRFVGGFRGLAGLAPTGKTYEIVAIEWFEFEGDRIARRWGARDFDRIKSMVLQAD